MLTAQSHHIHCYQIMKYKILIYYRNFRDGGNTDKNRYLNKINNQTMHEI